MQVPSLGGESPLEKEMAICSSMLAWESPGTEEPDGLQATGSQRVGHNSRFILIFIYLAAQVLCGLSGSVMSDSL